MKRIPLTKGKYATVDDDDYDRLIQWRWHVTQNGYAVRVVYLDRVNGKQKSRLILMHRLINRTPRGKLTDHIDGDKLNNSKRNLRSANTRQNGHNRRGRQNKKYSTYKGITYNKLAGKWMAAIRVGGRQRHLGYFTKEVTAARAYDVAAVKYFGRFAKINKV